MASLTHPRLIPRSGKEGNEQSERILDNNLKQMNIGKERLDLAGKIGGYWGHEYGLDDQVVVKISDIIDRSKPLDDRVLKVPLHILNTIDEDAGVLGENFIGELKLVKSTWSEMRKYVKPVEKESWEPMSDLAPNINDQVLYIPVRKEMNGKHSEWACIVRLETEDDDTPWTFMVFDPKDCMGDTVREMRKLIHKKSTLHLSEGLMDEVDNKEARKNTNTKWHHIMSPPLEGCEDGHRMVLHMILTIGVRSTTEMLCRNGALKEVMLERIGTSVKVCVAKSDKREG